MSSQNVADEVDPGKFSIFGDLKLPRMISDDLLTLI